MKKAFVISGVFISSLIGAGFASGSEILFYFSRYGAKGIFSIVSAVALFGVLNYLIISQSSEYGVKSFDEYTKLIMGEKMSKFILIFAYAFMMIIFSAMLCGFGEMCNQIFGIKKLYGVIIMLVCCCFVLSGGYTLFVKTESFLAVFIVFSVLLTALYVLMFRESNIAVFSLTDNYVVSGISYVSYNILTTSAVLCIMGDGTDKKTALYSGIITSVSLALIMIVMWYIICLYSGMINLGEIPFLTICMRQSAFCGYFYSIVIFMSMLTTAVSNGYILIRKLSVSIGRFAMLIVIFTGFLLSGFEFSFVIDKLYRIAGIISVLLVFCVIKLFLKKIIKVRKIKKIEDN